MSAIDLPSRQNWEMQAIERYYHRNARGGEGQRQSAATQLLRQPVQYQPVQYQPEVNC
ncbi:hypothetical protein [Rubinisphaera sp. JC750]|uniref:hypothetical protein n=1 Tax=Rubinisphaera sp. JC750 TaxID=2898658 RepID=UPI001F3DB26F|nr:hypothetical protein [Rubinisphaera sp. JC750]